LRGAANLTGVPCSESCKPPSKRMRKPAKSTATSAPVPVSVLPVLDTVYHSGMLLFNRELAFGLEAHCARAQMLFGGNLPYIFLHSAHRVFSPRLTGRITGATSRS
jgi:hypothetical protein